MNMKVVEEEEFIPGEEFDFSLSSNVPLTRARRSSILLNQPPLRYTSFFSLHYLLKDFSMRAE
jgi:hypothetical protein